MRPLVTLAAILTLATAGRAQEPRFRFAPGGVFATNVEQTTTVTETRPADAKRAAETLVSSVKVNLARRWTVRAVDPAGVATLDLTLTAMKQQITPAARPGEKPETIGVDSATPEGAAALKGVLNQVMVTAKLDATGQLLSAEGKNGAATGRLGAEPPFRLVWPAAPVAANVPWTRPATLTLDPPHGTGEKLELAQTFTLKGSRDGVLVVGLTTAPKVEPTDPAMKLAVAPVLWEGEIFFDPAAGRVTGCNLKVVREVADFAGPGSKFRYESTLVETAAK